jgi:hypothetical protein
VGLRLREAAIVKGHNWGDKFFRPSTKTFSAISNKRNKDVVIYVELATFNPGSMDRPVFQVKPQDTLAFDRFISERMWEQATAWCT